MNSSRDALQASTSRTTPVRVRIKRELSPILTVLALDTAILVPIELRTSPAPGAATLLFGAVASVLILLAPKYLLLGAARASPRGASSNSHVLYRWLFGLDLIFLALIWATTPTYAPDELSYIGVSIVAGLGGVFGLVVGIVGAVAILLRRRARPH